MTPKKKKLLEVVSEFSNVAGYKINIQKLVAFLYTKNKLSEREMKEKNSIYHCIKKKKIPMNKSN